MIILVLSSRDANVVYLDEPTASLDAQTEQALFEQLMSLAEDKTAVVISHRLFVTPLVDRILVLEDGRLVEEGSHDQLMKQGASTQRCSILRLECTGPGRHRRT